MLFEQIKSDVVEALKAKNSEKAGTLRFLLSELKNREIELATSDKPEMTDEEVMSVIRHEIKKRKESIEAYQKGNRPDLVEKEQKELALLSSYLPAGMSQEDLEKIVKDSIAAVGASSPADFGKVMGLVMGRVKGQADGTQVSEMVKKYLG